MSDPHAGLHSEQGALIASLLPAATKWRMFFKSQAKNPKYLKDGDVVEIAIGTDDGKLDLGRQRTVVKA